MSRGATVRTSVSLTSLGWLYLVQGIPYGLQDKFIPIQLRSRGLQYSSVSLLKALLFPWVAKGLWAPLVEIFGGKHCWLLVSLVALSASAYGGSLVIPEDVFEIGCVLLSLNVFSAIQDIAVDGLALEVLRDEHLGLGNTIQVVLYKVGCLLGGAGLTFLLDLTNWKITFNFLAFLYLFTAAWSIHLPTSSNMFVKYSVVDKENKRKSSFKAGNDSQVNLDSAQDMSQCKDKAESQIKKVFGIIREVVTTPGTGWLSLYVLLYKMGERGAINNMPLFLLDKGMSKHLLAFWNGSVCQGLSILGSFYGGITLANKDADIKNVLLLHSVYRVFAVLVMLVLITLWNEHYISIYFSSGIVSMCSLSFTSGVISTASFTLMMKVSRACKGETQASHYSALASIEIAGKLVFATLAGFVIESVGMASAFLTFTVLCTLPCMVLLIIPSHLCHLKNE
ncbi:major facilitator superfamily domain-containing protein 3-like [Penaeus indicus]|uniref:major facilitator superfamily domain-containing protein 3-like n=1 Tax=Penaeus indicus TaxID=29960 RepID=UPI00300C5BBE